jgi:hypothetical protein
MYLRQGSLAGQGIPGSLLGIIWSMPADRDSTFKIKENLCSYSLIRSALDEEKLTPSSLGLMTNKLLVRLPHHRHPCRPFPFTDTFYSHGFHGRYLMVKLCPPGFLAFNPTNGRSVIGKVSVLYNQVFLLLGKIAHELASWTITPVLASLGISL